MTAAEQAFEEWWTVIQKEHDHALPVYTKHIAKKAYLAATERTARRCSEAVVANCAACNGKGWTGGIRIEPECCGNFHPTTGECCSLPIPKQIDAREQCQYCGMPASAIAKEFGLD